MHCLKTIVNTSHTIVVEFNNIIHVMKDIRE